MLLQAKVGVDIGKIHESAKLAKVVLGENLLDIVSAYDSIALFHEGDVDGIIQLLSDSNVTTEFFPQKWKRMEVPICYELGMDVEEVASHTCLDVEEVIARHLATHYQVAFIGFTPGFIYLEGLDPKLACPRRENPRIRIEPGSIGIGGEQAGIYSLGSPGGWNIVGRTPLQLFDPQKQPPLAVEVGATIGFVRISKADFERWGS